MKANDHIGLEQLRERLIVSNAQKDSTSQINSEKQKRYQARRTFAEMIIVKICTIWPTEDVRLSDERMYAIQLENFVKVLDGLTPTQVSVGIDRITFQKYPPTPYEFRQLCLPNLEDAGLAEIETVYQALCQRVTDKTILLSPPVAWIYKHIDTGLLMDSRRQKEARQIVAKWYSRAAEKISLGHDFTEQDPLPIEVKTDPVAPPMTEAEMLEIWQQMNWTGIMESYRKKRGRHGN